MDVLIWHVHGSWTTSFVQGRHTYLLPVVEDRSADGRGRARTWHWPTSAVELTPDELADRRPDVVVVQRPRDVQLCRRWTGLEPGRDVPMVWLEHDAPQGRIDAMQHPARDRNDCTVVHVTHTNALFWDTGTTRTRVIEHGVVDPGRRATFEVPSAGVVVNEPVRRGRVAGTDLLAGFVCTAPLDVFGMEVHQLVAHGGPLDGLPEGVVRTHIDLPQATLHTELARRRVYLHPFRWTSLGLSLIEAMLLGLPVVALATTETPRAVPPDAGVVSNDLAELHHGLDRFVRDPDLARRHGQAAREAALARYPLDRFLHEWDRLLEEL
jgi:hypothetical protein